VFLSLPLLLRHWGFSSSSSSSSAFYPVFNGPGEINGSFKDVSLFSLRTHGGFSPF